MDGVFDAFFHGDLTSGDIQIGKLQLGAAGSAALGSAWHAAEAWGVDDGRDVREMELDARVQWVVEHEGRLRTDDGLVVEIRSGQIDKLFFTQDWLSDWQSAGLFTESAIASRFGKPSAVRVVGSSKLLYFVERACCLFVRRDDQQLERVIFQRESTPPDLKRDQVCFGGGFVGRLQELRQGLVYEGLLEGEPNSAMNDRHIASIVDKAAGFHCPVKLLEPERIPLERRRRDDAERIDSVYCIGRFDCLAPARSTDEDGSQLVVVWFQPQFAMPIATNIRQQMEQLDWSAFAADYCW